MFLDWLLNTRKGNISYEELKMSAQDKSRWSQWRWKPAIWQNTAERPGLTVQGFQHTMTQLKPFWHATNSVSAVKASPIRTEMPSILTTSHRRNLLDVSLLLHSSLTTLWYIKQLNIVHTSRRKEPISLADTNRNEWHVKLNYIPHAVQNVTCNINHNINKIQLHSDLEVHW